MAEDTAMSKTLQLYANPQMIQASALDQLESQVLGGSPVVDGNNVFTFTTEFNAQCTAGFASAVSRKFESLYPSRAQTFADLYGHMSDFDYEGLYGYPSTTTVELVFERNFIINNAATVDGNTDYRKIILPQYSTFTIGNYKFGIHYPIEIQVRLAYKQNEDGRDTSEIDYDNCIITTQWDLSQTNPLVEYASNILEHRNYIKDGIHLICISVPIYQFEIASHTNDSISNTGFCRKFDYDNKFYVCRVYHKLNSTWEEMSQTYSDIVYDPDNPTAMVRVYPDTNQVSVEIPQIYFSKQLVGTKIKVEIYTTLGNLNVDISTYTSDQFDASFLLDNDRVSESKYSNMLKYVSICQVLPLSNLISSGHDGLSFEELKRRVVNNTEKTLLITADKIASYLKGRGFNAKTYLDNITDRRYLAEKALTDKEGTIVSAGSFNTVFTSRDLLSKYNEETNNTEFVNHDTFKYIDTNTFMVLPSTIYAYDRDTDSAYPMDNEWMAEYNEMSNEDKVNLFNGSICSFSPFHLKVTINNTTPVASYYDMLTPKISNTKFLDENTRTNTQVSIYSSRINYNEDMSGYTLDVMLYQTDNIKSVTIIDPENPNEDNIYCLLRVAMQDGNYTYAFGKPQKQINGHNVISFKLLSDFAIDANDQLILTNFVTAGATSKVKLEDNYELMFFIKPKYASNGIGPHPANIPEFLTNFVWLATQQITIKLGEPINNLLASMYMEPEAEELATYPTTTFSTYNNNVYARYTEEDVNNGTISNGVKVTSDQVGTVKFPLEVVHYAGDVIISNQGANTKGITMSVVNVGSEETTTNVYALDGVYTPNATPFMTFESVEQDPEDHNNAKFTKITENNIDGYAGRKYFCVDKSGKVDYSTLSKTVFLSTGKIIKTEDICEFIVNNISKANTFDEVNDLFTQVTSEGLLSPGTGYPFVLVKDSSSDDSEPEYSKLELGTGSAIYRRDNTVNIDNFSNIKYVDNNGNQQYFDLDALYRFFDSMDIANATSSSIITEWGITTEAYDTLRKIRFPYIKVMNINDGGCVNDLNSYVNTASYVKIKDPESDNLIETSILTKTLRDIQKDLLNPINLYDRVAEVEAAKDSLPEGSVVYVADTEDMINAMFADLPVSDNETKGALGIINTSVDTTTMTEVKSVKWIVCGPSSSRCKSFINSMNTFYGFVQTMYDEKGKLTHYRYLSYVDEEQTKLNLDIDTVNWSMIYQWPWEISIPWIDNKSSLNTKGITAYLNDSSVVISQQAGAAKYEDGTLWSNIASSGDKNYVPIDSAHASTRKVTYNIRMLHADYKLLLSEETEHSTYKSDIITKIRNYFDIMDETKLRLLEGTDLYYSPIRTMGYAKFRGNMGYAIYSDLNIEIGFRLHVESYITADITTKDIIRNNILKIIDAHIATGTISLTAIATEIQAAMGDMIIHVDVLGINGDVNTQTLLRADSSTIPHLGYRLTIGNDRVIRVERNLTLEYSIIN